MLIKIVTLWLIGAVISFGIVGVYTYNLMIDHCGYSKKKFFQELKESLCFGELIKVVLYIVSWPFTFAVTMHAMMGAKKAFMDLKPLDKELDN